RTGFSVRIPQSALGLETSVPRARRISAGRIEDVGMEPRCVPGRRTGSLWCVPYAAQFARCGKETRVSRGGRGRGLAQPRAERGIAVACALDWRAASKVP